MRNAEKILAGLLIMAVAIIVTPCDLQPLPFDLGDWVADDTTQFWGVVTKISYVYVGEGLPPQILVEVTSRNPHGSIPMSLIVEEFDVQRLHLIRDPE